MNPKTTMMILALPGWASWILHAYYCGVIDTRRRAVQIGIAGFLLGMGLGVMAGGEMV
jgi:hypothetical protein